MTHLLHRVVLKSGKKSSFFDGREDLRGKYREHKHLFFLRQKGVILLNRPALYRPRLKIQLILLLQNPQNSSRISIFYAVWNSFPARINGYIPNWISIFVTLCGKEK